MSISKKNLDKLRNLIKDENLMQDNNISNYKIAKLFELIKKGKLKQ